MLAKPFLAIAKLVEKSPMEFPHASTVSPSTCMSSRSKSASHHTCNLSPKW